MNLTSPSHVRALLDDIGFKPSKLLGQNFLIDRNILDIIIKTAGLTSADHVLEIGPGLGVVTQQLLDKAGSVIAVEKDKRLFAYLQEKFKDVPNLRLINADMLDVDTGELIESGVQKVVSNLPYSVGSRILVDMMMAEPNPELIVVTVQFEVARRLAAQPDSKEYGVLSVWAQAGYDVEMVKSISPGCFWPKPEVTSAIVCMKKHDHFPLTCMQKKVFFSLTKKMFAYRRKQLASSLGRVPDLIKMSQKEIGAILENTGIDAKSRPENIGIAKWCELVKALTYGK
ncbi:MAG: 16S rRNA (adenine(1518)-N(6)/adenine(1519)-N(6))-dimethyltransferase RsmA [Kiritimatiellae bacterium]|nr:16S rRNA (adenine(1518)-N(6)/adenine(1519)-N(6))-dimethyltransferase RsmA [Kiritimatiellia bacterium]MDD5521675.1 16S rRNA (adenine(1518)-N(6)/adenine(1519)-N(6))-dimethyltransferase RsmA [Kiritimatiellia bacterium]